MAKNQDVGKPYPNHIRYYIKQKGYSIQAFAEKAGIPRRTLTDYLGGARPVPRGCLKKIARLLGCSVNVLAPASEVVSCSSSSRGTEKEREKGELIVPFVEQPSFLASESGILMINKSRRYTLQQMLGITGAAAMGMATPQELLDIEPWERLSKVLAKPSTIDEGTLHSLEMIQESHWRLFYAVPASDLLNGALGYLQTVTSMLQSSHTPGTYNRLCSLASQASLLVGRASLDMSNYDTTRKYYSVSLDAARETGNDALCALVLGRIAGIPRRYNHSRWALPYLQEANRLATGCATPPSTHAWLMAKEAALLAGVHEETLCLRTLEKTELLSEQMEEEHDPLWSNLDRPTMLDFKGICYRRLGRLDDAYAVVQEALATSHPTFMRQRATFLTDLSRICTQQGKPEEACRHASQALVFVSQTKSRMELKRLGPVRRLLTQWNDAACVRQLDEQTKVVLAELVH